MARLFIATPAGAGTRNGNRHTALRWATLLRASGHRVRVAVEWTGEPCDLLIALHARRSFASIERFKPAAGRPLVVVLTGTDLYRDLPNSREARRSLELADRLVVLQDDAPRLLSKALRRKTRIVYQSADPRRKAAPPRDRFRVAVIGHLRDEKDPLRTALALRHVDDPDVEVLHVGAALDARLGVEAKKLMAQDPRYRWLGALPHGRTLDWLARSHALVVSSRMEGGANVIAEAARIGVPVLASRMSGNLGMLGRDYPGYFPLGNERALARLLARCRNEAFMKALKERMAQRRKLFSPAAERAALSSAIRGLVS